MKTDYITASSTLPPYLAYPRFLLGMDLRLITKEVYCNRAKYCPNCATRMKRTTATERKRKQRQNCHALELKKP